LVKIIHDMNEMTGHLQTRVQLDNGNNGPLLRLEVVGFDWSRWQACWPSEAGVWTLLSLSLVLFLSPLLTW
jgi:hypothetical protein